MTRNFQGHGPAGQKLPSDWQAMAAIRAQQASADYLYRLENSWRENRNHATLIQSARLSNHPQPAPPRRDSRTDARVDSSMYLIRDDDVEQIWRDSTGAIVTIRKRHR